MTSTAIVVPCYNEAERLPVESFVDFVRSDEKTRFLLMDDGSTDSTHQVLSHLASVTGDRCEVHRLPQNRGKAEAVRRGVNQAMATGAELVGFWDADLATPLDAIAPLREELHRDSRVLAVFGSRVRMLGRDIDRDPIRHYAGRVFATVVSVMLQVPIYDSQCGAKLFRVTSLTEEVFAEEFVSPWIFDVEILARLRAGVGPEQWSRAGELIREYPLETWRDVAGSKLKSGDFVRSFSDLARIYQRYIAT
ncbi:MAG: glycosyltransferase [Acidobacteriota bacterium]